MKTLETPNHDGAQRLFILIAGLWVGSLLTVGYLVAPAIFSTMTDRQAAGMGENRQGHPKHQAGQDQARKERPGGTN